MTKFNLKSYKLQKTQNILKKNSLVFIYSTTNSKYKSWLKLEQTLYKNNLKCFKIYNTLSKKSLKNSIFKNVGTTIQGSTCLMYFNNNIKMDTDLKRLTVLNSELLFLGLKLNKKIYSSAELKNFKTLNYQKTAKVLCSSLKNLLKIPYRKLKSK